MKIDEITAPMTQRLFNKMSTDGYALATIKKIKFLLGQFFEYCVDSDSLKVNPVAKTKLASRERKVQTAEEYKTIPPELRKDFVKALDTSPILKPICYTSLFAGLRIGEVLALRWCDIDFTDKNHLGGQRRDGHSALQRRRRSYGARNGDFRYKDGSERLERADAASTHRLFERTPQAP